MIPYYDDGAVTVFHGDALKLLGELPDASVGCCITSPPYWGLRDYGTAEWEGGNPDCDHACSRGAQGPTGQRAGRTFTAQMIYKSECGLCGARRIDSQIGLEATPADFVATMVEVFSGVRRVLCDDGTLWLNLGDSYCGSPGNSRGDESRGQTNPVHRSASDKSGPGLKTKDLVGIPWRVAFALQDAGWWLRSDIIWAKPAPMPESVTDRPTRSHEYVFLLAKSERYFYDAEAIKEPSVSDHASGNGYKRNARLSFSDDAGASGSDEPWKPNRVPAGWHQGTRPLEGFAPRDQRDVGITRGKNSTQPEQHSARRMAESVALAREQGAHHDSPFGATRNKRDVWTVHTDPFNEAHFATFPPQLILPCVLAGCPAGGTILDPFFGAGTTGLVAKENGRKCIGLELRSDYIDIAARRLSQEVLYNHLQH